MSTVEEIEQAIIRLQPAEYERLRAWLDEREAEEADRRLEEAVTAGHFDAMAAKALADVKAGRTTPL